MKKLKYWWRRWREMRAARATAKNPASDLSLESLEPRINLSGDIRFDPATGCVTIEGTAGDDLATVVPVDSAHFRVQLTNAQSTQALIVAFSQANRIEFYGYDGDDQFENQVEVYSLARGHGGDDTLRAGLGNNHLFGDNGDDVLIGGPRNDGLFGGDGVDQLSGGGGHDLISGGANSDIIRGQEGDDRLYGDMGNDTIYGGPGNDSIWGYWGDDEIWGGAGHDWIYGQQNQDRLGGGPGNDRMWGGEHDDHLSGGSGNDEMNGGSGDDIVLGDDGADVLRGWNGNDLLRGGHGDDRLLGDNGDDQLLGDSGADDLRGGAGHDALFGGQRSSTDRLIGNSGRDRFLVELDDQVIDRSSFDAVLRFEPGNSGWYESEIEVMDQAFAKLFAATGNYRLLQDSLDSDQTIVFRKFGSLDGGAISISRLQTTTVNGVTTYRRRIDFREWDQTDPQANALMVESMIHEIGHSWDSSFEIMQHLPLSGHLWNQFLALSGWRTTTPAHPELYYRSGDGNWWYLRDSQFVRDYSRANPYEDWSTVWEYYFDEYQSGQPTPGGLSSKLAKVNSLFLQLGNLG